MTDRERAFASLGLEYAEGVNRYVLKHKQTGEYTARRGSPYFYTSRLQDACLYLTEEEAEEECLSEMEDIVSLEELFDG